MSRLASFQGPSTPSKSPGIASLDNNDSNEEPRTPNKSKNSFKSKKSKSSSSNTPTRTPITPTSPVSPTKIISPSKSAVRANNIDAYSIEEDSTFVETPIHKKLRQTLLEIRSIARKWDELSRVDGFKYAKEMIDARTGIQNELELVPQGSWPQSPVVGPKMKIINESLGALDETLDKMQNLFNRLVSLVDTMEVLYIDAVNRFHSLPSKNASTKSINANTIPLDPDSPLYPTSTWSLSRFGNVITSTIVPYYHQSLHSHRYMMAELRKPGTKWETARKILTVWRENPVSWRNLAQIQSDMSDNAIKGIGTGGSSFILAEGIYWPPGWSEELEEICKIEILGWK